MPLQCYIDKRFSVGSLQIIEHANAIIAEYQEQGFDLTLRQLYYQFVSRDLIANKDSEYKRLGGVIADARLAGLIDWDAITDRTRNLRSNSHWGNAQSIIESAAESFALDKWSDQKFRPEVWVEKDALVGVIESACSPLDVSYFSCRGYTSLSEVWCAAQRLIRYSNKGQTPVVIHLGDHDPSGIDMSRDIRDRLETFGATVFFKRVALNRDQIDEFGAPPNPAKVTDSRFMAYQQLHGDESWELDALDPATLAGLITDAVMDFRDETKWSAKEAEESQVKNSIAKVATNWNRVKKLIEKK